MQMFIQQISVFHVSRDMATALGKNGKCWQIICAIQHESLTF